MELSKEVIRPYDNFWNVLEENCYYDLLDKSLTFDEVSRVTSPIVEGLRRRIV